MLRVSNSGRRTYFMKPICAVGLVTRSLNCQNINILLIIYLLMFLFLYLSMNGANGSSFVFSKSDWLKYSSSKHSNQPSDTWGKQVKTVQESWYWYCSYQERSAFIRDVAGLDQNHLQSIQMVLRAVVKVVQFLFEILQNLCMTSHIRSKYQDDHVL